MAARVPRGAVIKCSPGGGAAPLISRPDRPKPIRGTVRGAVRSLPLSVCDAQHDCIGGC